ncbi:all-alpha NTP pyrophosphatase [Fusarium albosuccineum]|uniref:All-alpha NTP pyrophosphatase n=1 Tax=Fusarium albosuccineum TaxID=1237068 RepID=A0A8H4KN37_9HYPO|nr:all-alpha NTP pyrophosphatase [Fusarium albosuccineum]
MKLTYSLVLLNWVLVPPNLAGSDQNIYEVCNSVDGARQCDGTLIIPVSSGPEYCIVKGQRKQCGVKINTKEVNVCDAVRKVMPDNSFLDNVNFYCGCLDQAILDSRNTNLWLDGEIGLNSPNPLDAALRNERCLADRDYPIKTNRRQVISTQLVAKDGWTILRAPEVASVAATAPLPASRSDSGHGKELAHRTFSQLGMGPYTQPHHPAPRCRTPALLLTILFQAQLGRHRLATTDFYRKLMSSKEVHDALTAFVAERDWAQFHTPENLAKSVAIEAGELLECFQWNAEADPKRVREELADVLTYCLLLADKIGVDPAQIVLEKLEITREKYPVDKAKGSSKKMPSRRGETMMRHTATGLSSKGHLRRESLNAAGRMRQHLETPAKQHLKNSHVIFDERFNKSVSLDLESHLIKMLAGDGANRVLNRDNGITESRYFQREMYREGFRNIF